MLSVRSNHRTAVDRQPSQRSATRRGARPSQPASVVPTAAPGIRPSLARRLLDVTVATIVLGLVWPFLLVLTVAARRSTGGSAIYRQLRVGAGGVPFTLFKFRSMRVGATGPEVTAPGDGRVTRLGALLRKTSIDELPQLINVLLGDMTLVGPRPETIALATRYPAELSFVFRYRPGLTGPSQVLARDEKVLGRVEDVENFYLTELVPHRVAMDLSYLRDPTITSTVRWLADTFLYLLRITRTGPFRPVKTTCFEKR
jgi:lipopolysaccharide/colanic/teichoic acid biosynthesis glycosyltransferase